jgi:nicotinate-nucleotide pyrophosphorylase (carboxylating)
LREDLGAGDITSSAIIGNKLLKSATVLCKEETPVVIAGLEEAELIFEICNCTANCLVKDGAIVTKGKTVLMIQGEAKNILKAERTALNFLMRMSGIATETKRYVNAVNEISNDIKILSTRKTAPGLRYFDKKAVKIGGGYPHRKSLGDMVLIKDNHIALTGRVKNSVLNARKSVGKGIKIECEVSNINAAIEAIHSGANIIMLDNFSPSEVKHAIRKLETMGLRQRSLIEVSGGVKLNNIREYAQAMPDMISLGALTHSVKSADFSLDIKA